jgi:hypothetical protein
LFSRLRAKLFDGGLDVNDEIGFAFFPKFIHLPVSQESDQNRIGVGWLFFKNMHDSETGVVGFRQAYGIIKRPVGVFRKIGCEQNMADFGFLNLRSLKKSKAALKRLRSSKMT